MAKPSFTKGMSEREFLNSIYDKVTEDLRAVEGVNFFKNVYTYLNKEMTDDNILKNESGQVMLDIVKSAEGTGDPETPFFRKKGLPWGLIIKILIEIAIIILDIIKEKEK